MTKKQQATIALVFGSFIGAWAFAIHISDPLPVIIWFGLGIALAAAGG